jgi:hypothetical protein
VFRRLTRVLLTVVLVAVAAVPAHAFDNARKGFVLGFGFGPGYLSAEHKIELNGVPPFTSSEDNGAMSVNFKIGAGLSDRFLLFVLSQTTWFSSDSGLNLKDETVSPNVFGVGASYYLNAEEPSFYVTAGVGGSSWDTPLGGEPRYGYGFVGGLGYEFRRFWHFEATFLWATGEDDGQHVSSDWWATAVNFIALGY